MKGLCNISGGGEAKLTNKYQGAMSSWQGISYTFDGKYESAVVTVANSRESNRGYRMYANISNATSVTDLGATYTTKSNDSELSTRTYILKGITEKTVISVPQRSDNIALSVVAIGGGLTKYISYLKNIFRKKVLA